MKQISHKYVPPGTDVPGVAGKEERVFKTLKRGSTSISMEYSQPWEGGIKAEWTFDLNVSVR